MTHVLDLKDRAARETQLAKQGVNLVDLSGSPAERAARPLSNRDSAVLLRPVIQEDEGSGRHISLMGERIDLSERNDVTDYLKEEGYPPRD